MKNLEMFARVSQELECSQQDQQKITSAIINYIEKFNSSIDYDKAYYAKKPLPTDAFNVKNFTQKWAIEDIVSFLDDVLDKNSLNSVSGGQLGYIPGGGLYPTALADFISAATNRFSTYYDLSPPAVELENLVTKWLCRIGYPETSGGYLTAGGSTANLIALHVARHHHKIKSADFTRTVVYLTTHTHESVRKALHVIGLDEAIIKTIPVDSDYHMNTEYLECEIQADLKNQLLPWLIVAAAGTTDVGSVDPLEKLSLISDKYNLWLHIDAAYGGFFLLTDYGTKLFDAMKKANSIVMDPHKSLFLSYGSGAVLIKNRDHLLSTYFSTANYLPDDETKESAKISHVIYLLNLPAIFVHYVFGLS